MKTKIVFKHYALVIRVVRPDAEVELAQPITSTIRGFWDAFIQLGLKVKAPVSYPTGEDMGIIKNLLRKHGDQRLLEYGRIFWQHYAQSYFENPTHLMRVFAGQLPKIEREI